MRTRISSAIASVWLPMEWAATLRARWRAGSSSSRSNRSTTGEPLELLGFEPLLNTINTRIRVVGSENGTTGMGTTVVGVALIPNGSGSSAVVFNVGDSRCYRLAKDLFQQVTVDHSHVQELIESGEITPDQASVHPMRNVVTRALGVESTVRADYTVLDETSCRLLLCSDGLSGEMDQQAIVEVLQHEVDPNLAALRLVEFVLEGQAPDNITAVVVDVEFGPGGGGDADDTRPKPDNAAADITAPRAAVAARSAPPINHCQSDDEEDTL